jgi:hypothetical protein
MYLHLINGFIGVDLLRLETLASQWSLLDSITVMVLMRYGIFTLLNLIHVLPRTQYCA